MSVYVRSGFISMDYEGSTVKEWAGDSQWRACFADFARFRTYGKCGWGSEGFWALLIYRLQRIASGLRPRWFWAPLRLVLSVWRKLFVIVTHIDIGSNAEIGPGLLIPHVGPITVHHATKIGADCALHQMTNIGAGPRPGGATIGDHVTICCNSSIIGAVTIGDGAIIGANSLVIADVPAGATAIGVPARNLPGMSEGMNPRQRPPRDKREKPCESGGSMSGATEQRD
jgi:serine O-acetyltransferase